MFTLPIITYYFTFYWLFSHKDQPENWAALVSILVVNIIIGIYTYSAFTEPEDETRMSQPRNKSDKIRTDWYWSNVNKGIVYGSREMTME